MDHEYMSPLDSFDQRDSEFNLKLMKRAIAIMVRVQRWCQEEKLLPLQSVILYRLSTNNMLDDLNMEFTEFLDLLIDNRVYEMEPMNPKVPDDKLLFASPQSYLQEHHGIVWLSDAPELKYAGINILGYVPVALKLSQENLYLFVEYLYQLVGVSNVCVTTVLSERAYSVPALLHLESATWRDKCVSVIRHPFDLSRASEKVRKSIWATQLKAKRRELGTVNLDIGQRFVFDGVFVGVLALSDFVRRHAKAPEFVQSMTLGDVVEILNWLKVKLVLTQKMNGECYLQNPALNYPIVRHFVRNGDNPHDPRWKCEMFKLSQSGTVVRGTSLGEITKAESERVALERLTKKAQMSQKQRRDNKEKKESVFDMRPEELTLLRLDVKMFMVHKKPMTYVEVQTDNGFLCKNTEVALNHVGRGKTSLQARMKVAEMMLSYLNQEEDV